VAFHQKSLLDHGETLMDEDLFKQNVSQKMVNKNVDAFVGQSFGYN
jgi:hypothetical protein